MKIVTPRIANPLISGKKRLRGKLFTDRTVQAVPRGRASSHLNHLAAPLASWRNRQLVFVSSLLASFPSHGGGGGDRGGAPPIHPALRLSSTPPSPCPHPLRPPDQRRRNPLLPRIAWPRWLARRARRCRCCCPQGGASGEAVPAGTLLPHLPAFAARPPPARRRQVPRRRLHRRRPRGHLQVTQNQTRARSN